MDKREGNLCLQSVRRTCFQTSVTDAFIRLINNIIMITMGKTGEFIATPDRNNVRVFICIFLYFFYLHIYIYIYISLKSRYDLKKVSEDSKINLFRRYKLCRERVERHDRETVFLSRIEFLKIITYWREFCLTGHS